jgi:hypothetical protein
MNKKKESSRSMKTRKRTGVERTDAWAVSPKEPVLCAGRELFDTRPPNLSDPSSERIGFFCHDDAAPKCCAGAGGFVWSTNVADLIDTEFLPSVEVTVYEDDERERIVSACKKIAAECRNGNVSLEDAVKELAEVLDSWVAFDWYGTYEQLRAGKDEFSQRVISDFFFDRGEDLSGRSAIPKHMKVTSELEPEFRAFLDGYGH